MSRGYYYRSRKSMARNQTKSELRHMEMRKGEKI